MFDCAKEYDAMLHKGINLSGEDKQFFIRGRLQDLCRRLPIDFHPSRILDFGCGIGDTTKLLGQLYPNADIIGFDTSDQAIEHASRNYGSARISFCNHNNLLQIGAVDLCYTNGVFHHIIPDERVAVIAQIRQILRPGGYFALFENNPWNPGTRLVMKRIPFDREAQPLNSRKAKRLLKEGGFPILSPARHLFYFPRSLAFLRLLESFLVRIPLGAQYYILAQK
jgi:trans-aconitate methyltransferase